MQQGSLLLIGSTEQVLASPLIDAVLADWPEEERPRRMRKTFAQVLAEPKSLTRVEVAWIICHETAPRGLFEVIGHLQDRRLPVMLTRPDETDPLGENIQQDVIVLPPDAAAPAASAVLRTLWGQSETIRELVNEVNILRAEHASMASQIDHMDEELRLAARLQREFLPVKMPKVEGLEICFLYRPATYVSGDIFDAVRLDEDHVGLFIADAVGHGVPAALITVHIKQSLKVKEIGRHLPKNYRLIPPSDVLAVLNREMINLQAGSVRTATALYGTFNFRTREFTFARAGHPLPLLLHADGSSELLESEGPLLGVFPDEPFEQKTVKLAAGDRLLFYSDGFETAFQITSGKARTSTQGLANNQYLSELMGLASGKLEDAVTQFASKLDQQIGSLNQVDDLTMVCLGVNPEDTAGQIEPNPATELRAAG